MHRCLIYGIWEDAKHKAFMALGYFTLLAHSCMVTNQGSLLEFECPGFLLRLPFIDVISCIIAHVI